MKNGSSDMDAKSKAASRSYSHLVHTDDRGNGVIERQHPRLFCIMSLVRSDHGSGQIRDATRTYVVRELQDVSDRNRH